MSLCFLGLIKSSPDHSASFPCHLWSSLTSLFPMCPVYFTPHTGVPALCPKSTTQVPLLSESCQHTHFLLLTSPNSTPLWPLAVLHSWHIIITFFYLLNVSFLSALSLQPGSILLMEWDRASCVPNCQIHTVCNMSSEYISSLMEDKNGLAFLLVWMTISYFKMLMATDYIK